jgi:hypothetical protein
LPFPFEAILRCPFAVDAWKDETRVIEVSGIAVRRDVVWRSGKRRRGGHHE